MVLHENGIEKASEEPLQRRTKVVWYHSLFWKITVFLVSSIVLAYLIGAAVGWLMVERDSLDQWRREAELNAQVTTSAVRSIYTFIAIESNEAGQITKIVSERPLGDDASILDTGFNPSDVLGLAAAQTKNNVWLFQKESGSKEFSSSADAFGTARQATLTLPSSAVSDRFFVGFADLGDVRHFIAFVPVVGPKGELQGALVTSIGQASVLFESQTRLLQNSLVLLLTILIVTGGVVTLIMRKLFTPVPSLIEALSRIAHNDTQSVTPFQKRNDEIGRFAVAIEMVREAVAERENLRQVRDVAIQMEHLAHHDTLTGLPNRAFFNKRLEEEIKGLGAGSRFNIMLLDLDRFKAINDGLGHASGDALLVAFADRLSLLLGPHDMAARLGGDEFAVLQMVRKDPVPEASRLSKAIIEAASRPFSLLGKEALVGTSVGISTAPSQGQDVSELLRNADVALYCAKSEGRGTFRFFKSGMEMSKDRENILQQDIELALQRGEFELHYQPIFSFSDPHPVEFEALIRWKHPVSGWISPVDFIPMAEKSGQIVAIGEWVLRRACADAMRFPNNARVAVNVSAVQLQQGDFGAKVKAALQRSGLESSRLEIELTETVLLSEAVAMNTLSEIRELGVDIALDDFGTGYSSISYLMALPISKIKIDRSFVADAQSREGNRAIVRGIVRLAEGLGLKTTAEGIETQAQLSFMRAAGCDRVQGYHLGRPMKITEVESRYQPSAGRKIHR
ncbi:EAL domain-containing protein [Agrobacterium larrymoorei]|uniref:EAL domain-containing protein n=1 Tax=Agrobacterium larrymoorei TaxID=160699 RepID=UPI00157222F5|nr:EAL domain-containing protein [Agrobacterium larrymoorei]NTJ41824.1 EAL domain-containing protein [Agrobacterium larrymoorei]